MFTPDEYRVTNPILSLTHSEKDICSSRRGIGRSTLSVALNAEQIQHVPPGETMKKKLVAMVVASAFALTACGADGSTADTTVPASDTTEMSQMPGTIVEVAQDNAEFSTLVAAVTAAGLGEALSGEGPLTVFAPTNAAFEALPAGLLEKLLLPENKDVLVKILTYHVVGAKVMAADVTAGDVTSLEGSTFAVTTDGGVMVNAANVITTDIPASNGVIHVIDAVIVPPSVDLSAL
jgi:uncharacterized surface protein with fasciclin (FAS1) repeats